MPPSNGDSSLDPPSNESEASRMSRAYSWFLAVNRARRLGSWRTCLEIGNVSLWDSGFEFGVYDLGFRV